ncbi:MAG: hypothetical protein ACLP7P_06255 [Rhodomicrobium sp.]
MQTLGGAGQNQESRVARALPGDQIFARLEKGFGRYIDNQTKLLPRKASKYRQTLKKPDLRVEHGRLT